MEHKKRYYFDYAATTPLDERVLEAMEPYHKKLWGNSTGLHQFSGEMRDALEGARSNFSRSLNVKASEIVFTSSATESNNALLKGIALANQHKGKHLIISEVEHASVYQVCQYLKTIGFEVSSLPVDANGYLDPEDLKKALRDDTIMVSVIHTSNELGTIQSIAEMGKICRDAGVVFHTDAVQSFAKLEIDAAALGIDALTASSHKIYGPLGAALQYCRSGIDCIPLLHGGSQENKQRASSVNVPAIVGFSKALDIYKEAGEQEHQRIGEFRRELVSFLENSIPNTKINGDPERSLYNILSVSFKKADGELLAMQLDRKGVAVTTGASCSTGKVKVSRVLEACKIRPEWVQGTIRISLGRFTTRAEIDYLKKILPSTVAEVRKIS